MILWHISTHSFNDVIHIFSVFSVCKIRLPHKRKRPNPTGTMRLLVVKSPCHKKRIHCKNGNMKRWYWRKRDCHLEERRPAAWASPSNDGRLENGSFRIAAWVDCVCGWPWCQISQAPPWDPEHEQLRRLGELHHQHCTTHKRKSAMESEEFPTAKKESMNISRSRSTSSQPKSSISPS